MTAGWETGPRLQGWDRCDEAVEKQAQKMALVDDDEASPAELRAAPRGRGGSTHFEGVTLRKQTRKVHPPQTGG